MDINYRPNPPRPSRIRKRALANLFASAIFISLLLPITFQQLFSYRVVSLSIKTWVIMAIPITIFSLAAPNTSRDEKLFREISLWLVFISIAVMCVFFRLARL